MDMDVKFHIHGNPGAFTWRSRVHILYRSVILCHIFFLHFRLWPLCVRCVVDVYVDGRLDVRPDNTAVVSGQSTVLRCHTDSGRSHAVSWLRRVVDGSAVETVAVACQLESNFTSVYRLTSDDSGQCDLTIISVTTSLTGYYRCRDSFTDTVDEQTAYVTMIGKLYNICLLYTSPSPRD